MTAGASTKPCKKNCVICACSGWKGRSGGKAQALNMAIYASSGGLRGHDGQYRAVLGKHALKNFIHNFMLDRRSKPRLGPSYATAS